MTPSILGKIMSKFGNDIDIIYIIIYNIHVHTLNTSTCLQVETLPHGRDLHEEKHIMGCSNWS